MTASISEHRPGRTAGRIAAIKVAAALVPGGLAAGMLAALAGLSSLGLDAFSIPFAATAAVLAMAPASPLARPRTVIIAYAASTIPALAAVAAVPASVVTATVIAGVAIILMVLLRAVHPPAAAGAAMIGLHGGDWMFLVVGVVPALTAVLAIALAAGALIPRYGYSWSSR